MFNTVITFDGDGNDSVIQQSTMERGGGIPYSPEEHEYGHVGPHNDYGAALHGDIKWVRGQHYNTLEWHYIDGLVQERRNSSALAMELRLSCTNPSIWT